jgi:hypothetical protein
LPTTVDSRGKLVGWFFSIGLIKVRPTVRNSPSIALSAARFLSTSKWVIGVVVRSLSHDPNLDIAAKQSPSIASIPTELSPLLSTSHTQELVFDREATPPALLFLDPRLRRRSYSVVEPQPQAQTAERPTEPSY